MAIIHEELCEMGARPLLIDGLFRKILIEYFSQTEEIEYPTLATKLYSSDVPTGIVIETVYKWDPKQTEKRPAILIKRGAWQPQHLAMFDGLKSVDANLDPTYFRFWQGEHQFICLSRSGAEADMLGAEIARFLLHYGPFIRSACNFMRFRLQSLSPLSKIKEATDIFAIAVGVQYVWEEGVTITEK
jgi:hypothetical protein